MKYLPLPRSINLQNLYILPTDFFGVKFHNMETKRKPLATSAKALLEKKWSTVAML
jgi:hypothetical protein